jgi:putative AlgH/UPF0301 family transcriptional regulator
MENCRICLEVEEEKGMISPCKCSGTQKFVHEECLRKWQRTIVDNAMKFPEMYEFREANRCNVCKSPYSHPLPFLWSSFQAFFSFLGFFHRYWLPFVTLCGFILLLFAVVLIPFLLNFVFFFCSGLGVCYLKGIRPRLIATAGGLRVGFIRTGPAVAGLAAGVLLRATAEVDAGVFAGAVVLLTAYSAQAGAVGFIVNKPYAAAQPALRLGGPVAAHSRHVLHDCPNVHGAQIVTENLCLGGVISQLPQTAQRRTMIGYCGWAPLQLDGEVRAGVWSVQGMAAAADVFQ